MYIIVRGEERQRERLKGKTISEFAKNLESEGWPTEFVNEEHRDRVKSEERRNERPLRHQDSIKISREMRFDQLKKIREIADEKGCEYVEHGYVDRDDNGNIIIRK